MEDTFPTTPGPARGDILRSTPKATLLSRRRPKPGISGMNVTLIAAIVFFYYNTTAPPRGHLLHYISLSTFDCNFRCQLLTEKFGINFWLKLLVSRFDWNFWLKLSLSTFDYRRAVEPSSEFSNSIYINDSCRRFDSKVAVLTWLLFVSKAELSNIRIELISTLFS